MAWSLPLVLDANRCSAAHWHVIISKNTRLQDESVVWRSESREVERACSVDDRQELTELEKPGVNEFLDEVGP